MQKTVLFGKSQLQNNTHKTHQQCQHCLQLQAQVDELTSLLSLKEQQISQLLGSSQNQVIAQVQQQLVEFGEKYATIKKKLRGIQMDNKELLMENEILQKQVQAYRARKQHQTHTNQQSTLNTHQQAHLTVNKQDSTMSDGFSAVSKQIQQTRQTEQARKIQQARQLEQSRMEQKSKQLQIELFVAVEKVTKLQVLIKEQSDEIVRLKELLARRNRIQEQRHQLIALLQ